MLPGKRMCYSDGLQMITAVCTYAQCMRMESQSDLNRNNDNRSINIPGVHVHGALLRILNETRLASLLGVIVNDKW